MTARILILSGTQLTVNPRVVKEADTLAHAGFLVEVLGGLFQNEFAAREHALHDGKRWKYTMLVDASSPEPQQRLKWQRLRIRRRIWRELYSRAHIASSRQLGYLGPEMLSYAVAHPADLVIAHNPSSVWVASRLIERGRRVAVDMEDWYSEDLTTEEKRYFPARALSAIEGDALRGSVFSTTTSRAMSEALSRTYDCVPPVVIYNSFPLSYAQTIDGRALDRRDKSLPSMIWFSQIVGPRRGLETVIDALHNVDVPCEVHLRGTVTDDYRSELLRRAPESARGRLFFHPQVPHAQLISRIAEHDIGIASEIPHTRSRDLTITNKVLLYLLGGLPVAASNTAGQREAKSMSDEAISIFQADDLNSVAQVLARLLRDKAFRERARASAADAARDVFSWEHSAPVLVDSVENALLAARR